MKYKYYEIIAAKLFEIPTEALWLRTREEEIVIPRMFCMKYRNEILKLSQALSGKRYNKDHATTINAVKTIQDYIETKHHIGEVYGDFITQCTERISCKKNQLSKTITIIGWTKYIETIKKQFIILTDLISEDENHNLIREHISVCSKKLKELKFLYQLEDEQKL